MGSLSSTPALGVLVIEFLIMMSITISGKNSQHHVKAFKSALAGRLAAQGQIIRLQESTSGRQAGVQIEGLSKILFTIRFEPKVVNKIVLQGFTHSGRLEEQEADSSGKTHYSR